MEEEIFLRDIKDHKMHVMNVNGVYRHLVFKKPGPNSWDLRFELVTFPGSLVYTGDAGTYTFSRCDDMFYFFNKDRINPGYWGEKCTSEDVSSRMLEYSPDAFKETIEEHVKDWAFDAREEGVGEDNITSEIERVEEEILGGDYQFELFARNLVDDYEPTESFEKGYSLRFQDFWEIKLTRSSYRYLWACYAIRWGVDTYFKNINS